jgi:hypothetical protein
VRIPLRAKTRILIRRAVLVEFRRARADNPAAMVVDEIAIQELNQLLGAYRGFPPGSFAEPSFGPNVYCFSYHTVFVRYAVHVTEENIGYFLS